MKLIQSTLSVIATVLALGNLSVAAQDEPTLSEKARIVSRCLEVVEMSEQDSNEFISRREYSVCMTLLSQIQLSVEKGEKPSVSENKKLCLSFIEQGVEELNPYLFEDSVSMECNEIVKSLTELL